MEGKKSPSQSARFSLPALDARRIGLCLLSTGILVALASYHPLDASPFNLRTVETTQNSLGLVGALASGALRETFGWSAWLTPLLILQLLLPKPWRLSVVSWVVRSILILSAASGLVFYLYHPHPQAVEASGWVGWAIGRWGVFTSTLFGKEASPGQGQMSSRVLVVSVCLLVFLRNAFRFACVRFWKMKSLPVSWRWLRAAYFQLGDYLSYIQFAWQNAPFYPRFWGKARARRAQYQLQPQTSATKPTINPEPPSKQPLAAKPKAKHPASSQNKPAARPKKKRAKSLPQKMLKPTARAPSAITAVPHQAEVSLPKNSESSADWAEQAAKLAADEMENPKIKIKVDKPSKKNI